MKRDDETLVVGDVVWGEGAAGLAFLAPPVIESLVAQPAAADVKGAYLLLTWQHLPSARPRHLFQSGFWPFRLSNKPPLARKTGRHAALGTCRRPGARIVPYSRIKTLAKVGTLNACAKTASRCIISWDGLGLGSSVSIESGHPILPQDALVSRSHRQEWLKSSMLAPLPSGGWTTWPESMDDIAGMRSFGRHIFLPIISSTSRWLWPLKGDEPMG